MDDDEDEDRSPRGSSGEGGSSMSQAAKRALMAKHDLVYGRAALEEKYPALRGGSIGYDVPGPHKERK